MAYPEVNPIYQPSMRFISNITNAFPAVVTTTQDHRYIDKTIVRIDIPPRFGMQQVNQQFGEIIVLSPTTFSIGIDTMQYDVFGASSVYPFSYQQAQSVPIGENNSILTAAVQNTLPH